MLIIDDELVFNQKLTDLLRANDFDVDQSYESEKGLLKAVGTHYQLVIIATLLSLDGVFVLEKLRKQSDVPVIMFCHGDCEKQRIEGYKKGADDFLLKSLSLEEILLRIQTLMRRTVGKPFARSESVESNGLILQKRGQLVIYEGQNIILTPLQFRLLWTLVENNKQVLSKSYLYQIVLDRTFKPYDRTLDMHLSRIRKKLLAIGMSAGCLKTVHGKGYRFF